MSLDHVAHVSIPDHYWESVHFDLEEGQDGRERLAATLQINETMMHVEAWEIVPTTPEDVFRPQEFKALDDDQLNSLIHASGAENGGPWYTTTIAGREYAVFASPFCD